MPVGNILKPGTQQVIVVKFGILGVPKNWSNWTPNRMALYSQKKEWLDTASILGRQARILAKVEVAIRGHPRRNIFIRMLRKRTLDKDGSYSACKPIIDGLKTILKRRKSNSKSFEEYEGAGLIFDDNPIHADWTVEQEITRDEPQVWIEVHIPES